MAVDSKAKRMSCIGVGLPVPSLLPVADSSVSAADRLHLSWLYAGIEAQVGKLIVSAIVKIRLIASQAVAFRQTASAEVEL